MALNAYLVIWLKVSKGIYLSIIFKKARSFSQQINCDMHIAVKIVRTHSPPPPQKKPTTTKKQRK